MQSGRRKSMSLISPDALIQANATLMVGVFFLVTLRQALKLPVTKEFIRRLHVPIILFVMSTTVLVLGDILHGSAVPNYNPESTTWGSEIIFVAGLAMVVSALGAVEW
jgi:hypothetical protein